MTDHGRLAPELAAGIQRVKRAKSIGVRAGNWLSLKQAQALLNAPDVTTLKGLRDRAIIAVLLGCALRQPAVAALTMGAVRADTAGGDGRGTPGGCAGADSLCTTASGETYPSAVCRHPVIETRRHQPPPPLTRQHSASGPTGVLKRTTGEPRYWAQ